MSKKRSKKRSDKRDKKREQPGRTTRPEAKPKSKARAKAGTGVGSKPSRAWTEDAKRKAVALLERRDVGVEQLASELGVEPETLRSWQARFEQEEQDTPMTREERLEINRLRRENERLRMECEILKKAATFFAKHRS